MPWKLICHTVFLSSAHITAIVGTPSSWQLLVLEFEFFYIKNYIYIILHIITLITLYIIYRHREVIQKYYLYTHTYLHICMCIMCVIIHTGMHAYERRWVYANGFTLLAFSSLFPLPPLSVPMSNSQHQQGCPQQWPKIHSAGYLFVC